MESISNAASNVYTTASKAIWGEQPTTQGNETAGNEPISGEQGKGTVTEPFDQGNSENQKITPSNPTTTTDSTTSTSKTDPTTSTSNAPMNPNNAAAGGEPRPLENTEGTGVTDKIGDPVKGSDVIPSNASSNPGAAPESGAAPTHKQQGADKPGDAPTGGETGAVKETKDDAEEILKKRDPNDHSGEPMKMHDGPEKKDIPTTQEERRESKVGQPGGQEHGKEPKGTGEEWIKTSGLSADGGDFDATKPGAGREADRLMEEKGIHKSADTKDSEPTSTGASGSGSGDKAEKEKVPLGEKIKTKLHIGHKDK